MAEVEEAGVLVVVVEEEAVAVEEAAVAEGAAVGEEVVVGEVEVKQLKMIFDTSCY